MHTRLRSCAAAAMRRDFVSEEAAPEEVVPPPVPTAYPSYPAPQRTTCSVIHQKAAQGELLWVKAALDAGADIGDREGLVRPARGPPRLPLHTRRIAPRAARRRVPTQRLRLGAAGPARRGGMHAVCRLAARHARCGGYGRAGAIEITTAAPPFPCFCSGVVRC